MSAARGLPGADVCQVDFSAFVQALGVFAKLTRAGTDPEQAAEMILEAMRKESLEHVIFPGEPRACLYLELVEINEAGEIAVGFGT
jgi:hypothetical protein